MPADPVSDFDYHPYEPHVRQFRVPRRNVLRFDAEAYVCDALFDDVVLRHFAARTASRRIDAALDLDPWGSRTVVRAGRLAGTRRMTPCGC